jgi:hypothetical protein
MPENAEQKKGWFRRRIERIRSPDSHMVKVGQDKVPIPAPAVAPPPVTKPVLVPPAPPLQTTTPAQLHTVSTLPAATASTTPPRLDIVDLNNPDNWNSPRGDGMEKGVHTEREHELDDVDSDLGDEEEDDEDEDDDEDDDEEDDEEDEEPKPRPPFPARRPPAPRALSREDLKTIIMEKFATGLTSYDINKWFLKENIIDQETGEVLSIKQIGGFKSIISSADANARNAAGMATAAAAAGIAAATQASDEKGKVVIHRPNSKLETFSAMLDKAMANGNDALAQIAVDGIYKEMEKSEHGGPDDKLWTLLTTMMTEGKGKSKLSELKELTGIVKDLIPPQPEGKSEAVQMAEVMSNTSLEIAKEAKDTALQISGSKNEADKMGKCPSCNKMIPMDSLYCSYCGLAFKQKFEVEGEEAEEEDEEEVKARQRAELEKRKRADIAKRAIASRKQQPPPPQRPSATQPTPQPVKPPAPAPQPAAPPQAPSPQPAGPAISPEERAAILHNLKRLANFIAAKDDPVLKTQALFKAGDGDDRKQGLFLAIVGRERLLKAARRLIQEHKELVDFQNYVELCDSVDGRAWIDTSFMELMKQAKLNGILLKKEEAATMLDKVEARLGFPID